MNDQTARTGTILDRIVADKREPKAHPTMLTRSSRGDHPVAQGGQLPAPTESLRPT